MRAAPVLVAVLAATNLALAVAGYARARPVTYVFTPLVNVVPGVLDADDAAELGTAESRDIQQAYARLGSTLSLDDLLRGVESLDDLSPAQQARLAAILAGARQDHADVLAVQAEILDLEATLGRQAADL